MSQHLNRLQRFLGAVTGFWLGCIGVAIVVCYLVGVITIVSIVLK